MHRMLHLLQHRTALPVRALKRRIHHHPTRNLRHVPYATAASTSGKPTTSVSHNRAVLEGFLSELHTRGIVFQQTEGLLQALSQKAGDEGERARIYAGFDPTSDGLHVGNLFVLMTLKRFLQLGFIDVVALVGGGTGLIGDPSGRKTERPLLSEEQVRHNVECIRQEVVRFMKSPHGGGEEGGEGMGTKKGEITVVNNHEWLSKIHFVELLRDYGKLFQMNQLLRLDSVKSRLEAPQSSSDGEDAATASSMTFTEFSYVLLQSFDFYHLYKNYGVRAQIGGSDQWGNIVSGIDLIKKKHNASAQKEKGPLSTPPPLVGGLTLPLLTTADGVKFGKSAGNAVFLNSNKTSVFDFYQYFVRVQDADVRKMLTMLTFLSLDEIDQVMEQHSPAPEKRVAQKELAREMTRAVHGEEELAKVERSTALLYGGDSGSGTEGGTSSTTAPSWTSLSKSEIKSLLKDAPSAFLDESAAFDKPIVRVLKDTGICKSSADARRTIQGGGLYINNVRIDSPQHVLQQSDVIDGQFVVVRVGKKNYHIIEIETSSS